MEYASSASTSKKIIAKYIDGMLSLIIVTLIQLTFQRTVDSFVFLSYWLTIAFIYNLIFTTGGRNTLGRFLMRVKIVEGDGSALTLKKGFKRQVLAVISLAALCVGYLISLFHDQKLTLHDRLVGTRVVDLAVLNKL